MGGNGACVAAGASVGAGAGVPRMGVPEAAARGVTKGPMVPRPGFTMMICPMVKIDVRLRLFN